MLPGSRGSGDGRTGAGIDVFRDQDARADEAHGDADDEDRADQDLGGGGFRHDWPGHRRPDEDGGLSGGSLPSPRRSRALGALASASFALASMNGAMNGIATRPATNSGRKITARLAIEPGSAIPASSWPVRRYAPSAA